VTDTADDFHRLYYPITFGNEWMGAKLVKCPLDMWEVATILHQSRPAVVVETGTAWGGSALFYAHMFDLVGSGDVITVDSGRMGTAPHPRITYLSGDSVAMAGTVAQMVDGRSAMVILDSDHTKAHVLAELDAYAPIVTSGQYLIVEDTNLGRQVGVEWKNNGPGDALDEWLPAHPEFQVDGSRERHLVTMNPGGWLRRS